jgi:hypothetical protein
MHFWRVKDLVTGKYEMKEVPAPHLAAQALTMNTVTVAPSPRHLCTACTPNKPFPTAGLLAVHFKRSHVELMEDKNTWRKYDAATRQ